MSLTNHLRTRQWIVQRQGGREERQVVWFSYSRGGDDFVGKIMTVGKERTDAGDKHRLYIFVYK